MLSDFRVVILKLCEIKQELVVAVRSTKILRNHFKNAILDCCCACLPCRQSWSFSQEFLGDCVKEHARRRASCLFVQTIVLVETHMVVTQTRLFVPAERKTITRPNACGTFVVFSQTKHDPPGSDDTYGYVRPFFASQNVSGYHHGINVQTTYQGTTYLLVEVEG